MQNDNDSTLTFPCDFPIKAMGLAIHDIEAIVLTIAQRHAPEITKSALTQRPSANGKYLSITVKVNAKSQEQLDAIYYELTAHEKIIMAL
ncbi:MAG: DUF493 domain-containing protein [Gammaproteobacteria bacterium]|nr:DUF493 domain-containing protein [Gammaproteobacteria bacterium]